MRHIINMVLVWALMLALTVSPAMARCYVYRSPGYRYCPPSRTVYVVCPPRCVVVAPCPPHPCWHADGPELRTTNRREVEPKPELPAEDVLPAPELAEPSLNDAPPEPPVAISPEQGPSEQGPTEQGPAEPGPAEGMPEDTPAAEPAVEKPADDLDALFESVPTAEEPEAELPSATESTEPAPADTPSAEEEMDDVLEDLFGSDEEVNEDEEGLDGDDLFDESADQPVEDPAEDTSDEEFSDEAPAEDASAEEESEEPVDEEPADESPEGDSSEDDDLFGHSPASKWNAMDRSTTGQLAVDGGLSSRKHRTWTDNTGRHTTRGRLLEIVSGKVRILKETGHTTSVPFYRLSAADLTFVHSQALAAHRDNLATQTAQN